MEEVTEAVIDSVETPPPPAVAVPESETPPSTEIAQKQAAWDAKREEVDSWGDGLGLGIDEGIKDTVVAFNMEGFNTTQSCEGHNDPDRGLLTPWVDITALNEPETRFVDEMATFQRVADAHGIPVENIRVPIKPEADLVYDEAYVAAAKNGKTNQYKAWLEQSIRLGERAQILLTEFYNGREASTEVKLTANLGSDTRIMAGDLVEVFGEFEQRVFNGNQGDADQKMQLLLARRAEMLVFTEFLKARYFAETNASAQPLAAAEQTGVIEPAIVQLPSVEAPHSDDIAEEQAA